MKSEGNIKEHKICGESGNVQADTDESQKERLPQIIKCCKGEVVWNVDETGCFWRVLPDKGLAQMRKECKDGKKASTG